MKRHSHGSGHHENAERWLMTYADLMNNLLALFMMLYAISVIDLQKFQKVSDSFVETLLAKNPEIVDATPIPGSTSMEILLDLSSLLGTDTSASPGDAAESTPDEATSDATLAPGATPTPVASPTPESLPTATSWEGWPGGPGGEKLSPDLVSKQGYDELFSKISLLVEQQGYSDQVSVEKRSDTIYVRFREGVFFFADSSDLKSEAYPILDTISKIIMDSYDLISTIDISGHTARVSKSPPSKTNLFSWELSTNRALTVLRYLIQKCDVPQDKLSVTGYSSNQLYVEGEGEEFYAQNRRVEIRLARNTTPAAQGQ